MAIWNKEFPISKKVGDGVELPFIKPRKKISCFLCAEQIDWTQGIYWAGSVATGAIGKEPESNTGYIFLHKHCASSLAAHLLSDFTRLNLSVTSR